MLSPTCTETVVKSPLQEVFDNLENITSVAENMEILQLIYVNLDELLNPVETVDLEYQFGPSWWMTANREINDLYFTWINEDDEAPYWQAWGGNSDYTDAGLNVIPYGPKANWLNAMNQFSVTISVPEDAFSAITFAITLSTQTGMAALLTGFTEDTSTVVQPGQSIVFTVAAADHGGFGDLTGPNGPMLLEIQASYVTDPLVETIRPMYRITSVETA